MSAISIECAVIDIFRTKAAENGTTWAVLKVFMSDMDKTSNDLKKLPGIFHLTGIIPHGLVAKDKLRCAGTIVEHEQYEPEFKASDITLIKPMTVPAVQDSLAEMVGVGRMNASRAIRAYIKEPDIIDAMISNPNGVKFMVGEHCAGMIVQHLKAKWGAHAGNEFLRTLGIRPADVKKICASMIHLGICMDETKKNPFAIVTDVGFKLCDSIRSSLNLPINMPERLDAGLVHIAENQCRTRGHCAVERESLIMESGETLSVSRDDMLASIARLLETRKLIGATLLGQDLLYPERFWNAEQDVIASFHRILTTESKAEENVEAFVPNEPFTPNESFTPSDDQIHALKEIARSRIVVLTGGPGVGKTTIIRHVLDAALARESRVVLCAPTGLAALRLKEACSYDASTIHRALGGSTRVPIGDADLIVVDEMSMVGIELFRNLITRVKDTATVLLVGDPDQLPSIDPGNTLRDIIDSGVIVTCRLTTIHRQGPGSLLCENIARIRVGEMPIEKPGCNEFTMRFFNDNQIMIEATKVCAKKLLENPLPGNKLFDVQIVVPTNAGSLGAEGLNRELRAIFNEPTSARVREIQSHEDKERPKYVVGDKVLQTENDYDRNVINGEIGCVTEIGASGNVVVRFDDRGFGSECFHGVNYNVVEQSQLKLAYAITVHKSQGSEFPYLVVVLSDSHGPLLNRKLLYTAFSRGKKKVVLISTRSALEKALGNTKNDVRYTGLAHGLAMKFGAES